MEERCGSRFFPQSLFVGMVFKELADAFFALAREERGQQAFIAILLAVLFYLLSLAAPKPPSVRLSICTLCGAKVSHSANGHPAGKKDMEIEKNGRGGDLLVRARLMATWVFV